VRLPALCAQAASALLLGQTRFGGRRRRPCRPCRRPPLQTPPPPPPKKRSNEDPEALAPDAPKPNAEDLKDEVRDMAKKMMASGIQLLVIDTENKFVSTGERGRGVGAVGVAYVVAARSLRRGGRVGRGARADGRTGLRRFLRPFLRRLPCPSCAP
jgi:hypothetical protein